MPYSNYYNIAADKAYAVYFKEDPILESNPQFHDSIEFIFVLNGTMEGHLESESMSLSAGDIFFAESYELHYYNNVSKDFKGIVLVISREYLKDLRTIYPGLTYPTFLTDKDKNKKIIDFVRDWLAIENKSLILNHGKIDVLFGMLVNEYQLIQRHDYTGNIFIKNFLKYVHNHYLENITLTSVAKELGFTVEYCSKVFKNTVSCNFKTYINSLRIRKVNELLADKSLSLTQSEIFYQCGFSSPATYFRVKKKLSPSLKNEIK